MLNDCTNLPVRVVKLTVQGTTRPDDTVQHTVRLKLEADLSGTGPIPFGRKAVMEILAESHRIHGQDPEGANTFELRMKQEFPVGVYTLKLLKGDSADRSSMLLNDVTATMSTTLKTMQDPHERIRVMRRTVGVSRTAMVSGSVAGSPAVRVVDGSMVLVWQLDAQVTGDTLLSLATMLDSEEVTVDVQSAQADLFNEDVSEPPAVRRPDPDAPEDRKRRSRPALAS